MDDIYFKDKNMDLFFTCLRNNTHEARIIITSRIFPKLRNGECLIDVIEGDRQDIKGLKTNFAVDYLKSGFKDLEYDKFEDNKLKELKNKLEKMAIGVNGHPMALQLLVELVKDCGVDDILEDLSLYQKQIKDTILIAKKLFEKLVGDEKGLLERVSVYREPGGMKGLKKMFTEMTSPNAIIRLIDKSLLETDHKGKYWLHPLVQEFSYKDLKNKKEVHLLAYNYYKALGIPKNPTRKEDLQSAIEAHYHACVAGEYDLAAFIIREFNLADLLGLWGYPRLLIEIYEKLLPEDHFKDEPILKDKGNLGSVFGNLGIVYSDLGKSKKAIDYFEKALKIAREIVDKQNEGIWLGNMGIAYYRLGKPKEAIDYFEKALKIHSEIGDKRNEGIRLGNLGVVYTDLGKPKEAIDYFEKALKIAREIGDRREESKALGNLGNAYSALDETKNAIEYYEQALEIAREIWDKRNEGIWLGNLGNAYSALDKTKNAIEYYERALIIAIEIDDIRGKGKWLGNLGIAYRDLGEMEKAIGYYKQAFELNPEDATVCYNKACAESLMNKRSEALVYLKHAIELDPIFKEIAKRDKDFEKLWEEKNFKDIVAAYQG